MKGYKGPKKARKVSNPMWIQIWNMMCEMVVLIFHQQRCKTLTFKSQSPFLHLFYQYLEFYYKAQFIYPWMRLQNWFLYPRFRHSNSLVAISTKIQLKKHNSNTTLSSFKDAQMLPPTIGQSIKDFDITHDSHACIVIWHL